MSKAAPLQNYIIVRGGDRLYHGGRCLCPVFYPDSGEAILLGELFIYRQGAPIIRTLGGLDLIVMEGAHWTIDDAISPDRITACRSVQEQGLW